MNVIVSIIQVVTVLEFSTAEQSEEVERHQSVFNYDGWSDQTLELHFGEEEMYVSDTADLNQSTNIGSVFLFGSSPALLEYKANLAESEQAYRQEQEEKQLMFDVSSNEDEESADVEEKESKDKPVNAITTDIIKVENEDKSVDAEEDPTDAKHSSVESTDYPRTPTSEQIEYMGAIILDGPMNAFWRRWQYLDLGHVNSDQDVFKGFTMVELMNQRLKDLQSATNVNIHYNMQLDVKKEIKRIYGMMEQNKATTLTLFETNVSPGIFNFNQLREFNYISAMRDEGSNLTILSPEVEFEIFMLISRNEHLLKMHLPQSTPQQLTRTIDQLKYRRQFSMHVGHDDFVQFSLSYTDIDLTAHLSLYSDNLLIGRLCRERKSIRNINLYLLSQKAMSIARPFFFDIELDSIGIFRAEKMSEPNVDPLKIVLAQVNTWKVFKGKDKWEDFSFKWQHLTIETTCDYGNEVELDQLREDMETIAKEVEGLKTFTLKFTNKSETRLTEIASRVCRIENKWVGYQINLQQSTISCL